MGKKKASTELKPIKAERKTDKMTASPEKTKDSKNQKSNNPKSNKMTAPPEKTKDNKNPKSNNQKSSNQKYSTTTTKSGSSMSGTTLFLVMMGGLVVLAAVIAVNTDVQNYLVSLTPIGSNPLEYILAAEKPSHSSHKNSASTSNNGDNRQTTQNLDRDKRTSENSETKSSEELHDVVVDKEIISEHKSDKSKNTKDDTPIQQTESKENLGNESVHDAKQGSANTDSDQTVDNLDNTTEKQKKKVKRKDYEKHEITSKADFKIRKKLDAADTLREEGKLKEALEKYSALLSSHPDSPRALYGKALVTDSFAEKQQSNKLLEEAMELMNRALRLDDTPKQLRILIGHKLAERQSFRGWEGKAAVTWRFLMDKYPDDITFQQKYGTSQLIMGKNDRAREVYRKILTRHPDDIYALVHLGFIVKVVDVNYDEAIPLLQKGIDLDVNSTIEGKFFYHLGDAYLRTNRSDKAASVYRQGAERGLFLSQYQRSLYNADTPLTGRPWWSPEQTTYQDQLKMLEKNWKTIREEGLTQLNPKTGSFLPEEENLRETGDWKQFTLYQRGRKNDDNCKKVPRTCALLERIPDAAGCKRGQIKYSVMHPGVHVWPHTGPTNCRIRAHLGLKVPQGPRIRVGNDTRTWVEGKFIIFDDSFEHEVWHDGEELRLVLIVDFWHPELTDQQKRTLTPI